MEKVTTSTEEVSFSDLTEGLNQLVIPLFQREYVWTKKQFQRFVEDIEAVIGGEDNTRFLGAVVAIDRLRTPGKVKQLELVDGQQRISTIYLTTLAIVERLAIAGMVETAREHLESYLVLPPRGKEGSPTKLVPCFADRAQFATIWSSILENPRFVAELKDYHIKPRPPAPSGPAKGQMASQYNEIKAWIIDREGEGGLDDLGKILEVITSKLSFVWLTLNDPSSASKIFESLNDRGVKTTVGSLVRNEVFSRLTNDAEEAHAIYDAKWKPFQEQFGNAFEKYFFPYCLIGNKNIKKSELFDELRKRWKDTDDASEIIKEMDNYSAEFLLLETNKAIHGLPKKISQRASRLHRMGAPSSVYPFFMQLLHAVRKGEISENDAIESFDVIESFLFRRAMCGYEPTGLHAVFKGLWDEVDGKPTAIEIEKRIRRRKTVPWPDGDEFVRAIGEKPLAGKVIDLYAVTEFEISLGADIPDNVAELEHILPQTITVEWKDDGWSLASHEKYVHSWANLIPNSPGMNKKVGQATFDRKKVVYAKDSMYASPRKVAATYDAWSPDDLKARTKVIQLWALKRWPY